MCSVGYDRDEDNSPHLLHLSFSSHKTSSNFKACSQLYTLLCRRHCFSDQTENLLQTLPQLPQPLVVAVSFSSDGDFFQQWWTMTRIWLPLNRYLRFPYLCDCRQRFSYTRAGEEQKSVKEILYLVLRPFRKYRHKLTFFRTHLLIKWKVKPAE